VRETRCALSATRVWCVQSECEAVMCCCQPRISSHSLRSQIPLYYCDIFWASECRLVLIDKLLATNRHIPKGSLAGKAAPPFPRCKRR